MPGCAVWMGCMESLLKRQSPITNFALEAEVCWQVSLKEELSLDEQDSLRPYLRSTPHPKSLLKREGGPA